MSARHVNESWLPTRGLTIPVSLGLTAAAVLVVGTGLIIYFVQTVHDHPLPASAFVTLIVVTAAFAVIIPMFSLLRRPLGVSLQDYGVEIVYPLKRVRVAWTELMRVRSVAQGILVFRVLLDSRNEFGGAYWISLEQARAILGDPRCPHVDMPEEMRRAVFRT